jgi:hypothetical protein
MQMGCSQLERTILVGERGGEKGVGYTREGGCVVLYRALIKCLALLEGSIDCLFLTLCFLFSEHFLGSHLNPRQESRGREIRRSIVIHESSFIGAL